jgi:hypothetical protein
MKALSAALVALALLLTACSSATPSEPPAASSESPAQSGLASGAPVATSGQVESGVPEPSDDSAPVDVIVQFGDGPFDLTEPSVGLADLSNYVATLAVTFDGTRAGSPVGGSSSATMSVSPQGRQLTIDRGGDGPPTYKAEIAGASYAKEGDAPCTGRSTGGDAELAASYEPAAQLPAVIGVDEAGSETVNEIATHHYTFDRKSVVLLNLAAASGEVWVADDGGYVVRYNLSFDAGADQFGEDTTGTRTLHYELSVPNEPIVIEPPADCPPPVDAPLLADAANVLNRPGIVSFTSAMSVSDAVRFYTDELNADGWEQIALSNQTESNALLAFTKPSSTLTVLIGSQPDGISVRVLAARH